MQKAGGEAEVVVEVAGAVEVVAEVIRLLKTNPSSRMSRRRSGRKDTSYGASLRQRWLDCLLRVRVWLARTAG